MLIMNFTLVRIVWWWGVWGFLMVRCCYGGLEWWGGVFFFLLQKYDGIELTSLLSCTVAPSVSVLVFVDRVGWMIVFVGFETYPTLDG